MIDFFVGLINYLIAGIGITLGWIIGIFPDSPFAEPAQPPAAFNVGWVTWLIDFPVMIGHTVVLTSAILTYYAIRVIARWIKIVRE